MSRFDGKTAIVTGATEGLGEVTARLLVTEGLGRMVVTGRNTKRGERVEEEAARAIAWLASDESGLMTGAFIDFDQSVIGAGDTPISASDEPGIN